MASITYIPTETRSIVSFQGFFFAVMIGHWFEHLAQAFEAYALGWPVHDAKGILGYLWPWLNHSETLHFGIALFMFVSMIYLTKDFPSQGRSWWLLALGIQAWHLVEHSLLLGQVIFGQNLLGAPQPISIIQLSGLLKGSAESGFGGLLTMKHFGLCDCIGATPGTFHRFEFLLLFVRRLEVHLFYNTLVTLPMLIALWCRKSHKPG